MNRKISTASLLLSTAVFATPLHPVHTMDLRTFVALRETVAAVAAGQGKLYLLITDRAPTGRSAILVETDTRFGATLWQDLGAPADSLTLAKNQLLASTPIPKGLRVFRRVGTVVQAIDLPGVTAAIGGGGSQLVRLLSTGELAVHDPAGIGSFRKLLPSVDLRNSHICRACGPGSAIPRGLYLIFPLPSNRVAVVERSSAQLQVLALQTGTLELSVTLTHPDVLQARSRNAAYLERIAAAGGAGANVATISAGASHPSGDIFLLLAPFHPAEGARLLRINPRGQVAASFECLYPSFKPEDGPPSFVTAHENTLYLVSARGKIMTFRIN